MISMKQGSDLEKEDIDKVEKNAGKDKNLLQDR